MNFINNDILEMNVITHSTESRQYSESCYSCLKRFEKNDKKIKWRLRITNNSSHIPPYAIWHLQCPECAIGTINEWKRQLDIVNLNHLIS